MKDKIVSLVRSFRAPNGHVVTNSISPLAELQSYGQFFKKFQDYEFHFIGNV